MKNKHAAMEMSVGTIVTIVLLMTVLVLGLVLIRSIFKSGTTAIDSIDDAVQNEIQKLFEEEGKRIAVYPSSRQFTIEKTDEGNSGFAFSVKNIGLEENSFSYSIQVDPNFDIKKCGTTFNAERGNSWLISGTSQTIGSIAPGNKMDLPEIVLLNIPEDAPPCTIPYLLEIKAGSESYASTKVFLTIE